MGNTPLQSLFNSWVSKMQIRILMVGLDCAGKTTILYQLKLGKIIDSIPVLGFNVEKVEYKNISFTAWDVGGAMKLRKQWMPQFIGASGIIFVIDTSDKERIHYAKDELFLLLADEELKDVPLLVLANKSEIAQISIIDMPQILNLIDLKRVWHIQNTCALTGDGLCEGLNWLQKQFKKNKQ